MTSHLTEDEYHRLARGYDENPRKSLSLNAETYTDPRWHKLDQNAIISRSWQWVCHVEKLRDPGSYLTTVIAEQPIALVRDRDGQLRGFYNVCKHRAHELLSGEGLATRIMCPYHAWTYELTGGLRAAPNAKSVEGFDKSKICLTEVRTEEFLGFIFVNLDTDAKPMDEWFPNARAELESFVPQWAELKPLEWIDIPENSNWKVSVENYSECYHCSLNHPTFSTGVIKPETYDIQPQGYCLRHTTESGPLDQMSYDINSGFENNEKYSSWFLWPMFSFQVYPGNVLNTYHWRAIDTDHVVVWRGWYSIDGVEDAKIRLLAVQDRDTTVEEDIHLVQSVQRGLSSRRYTPDHWSLTQLAALILTTL